MLLSSYRGPRAIIPAASVPLVVEIADTSAVYDRGPKARLYASGGIPEYWVVDIGAREVARFWSPGPDGYAREDAVAFGERLTSATIAGLAVDTAGLA